MIGVSPTRSQRILLCKHATVVILVSTKRISTWQGSILLGEDVSWFRSLISMILNCFLPLKHTLQSARMQLRVERSLRRDKRVYG